MFVKFRFILGVLFSVFLINTFIVPTLQNPLMGTAQAAEQKDFLGKGEYTGSYWPTKEWRACKPEAVGINSEKLSQAIEYAATPRFRTDGLVIIRKGYIAGEAYFGDFEIGSIHISNSMAKSFTSTLIGIAIDKGLIKGIDEKLCQYYPEWKCDDQKDFRSRITIRHALTLTTGLEWKENWIRIDPATNDALKMGATGHFVKYMAERKGLYEPGKKFEYSTGDPMFLSRVIQKATGISAFEYAKQTLFKPLNITDVRWQQDQDGYTATAWGLFTTVRDYAKFGYLFLNKGRWEDNQIVSKEWVEQATRTDPGVNGQPWYGHLWHVNLPVRLGAIGSIIPADGYMAEGTQGQNIFIIPSKDLVIVRVANETNARMDLVKFLTMVLSAIEK
jgi:CubicO group peptidase (beta-lactamase class C family)